MSDAQLKINVMHKGDRNAVIDGISSKNPIVVANAIIAGAQQNIKDSKFILELKNLVDSTDIVLMGLPVSFIAIAALDILDVEKYQGDDDYIQSLINSKLAF